MGAPPKAKAPKPPGGNKKVSKVKNYNKHNNNNSNDNTYELTKTAASAAGTAAKQLFKSFGSKVTKDVKSFTKSELPSVNIKKPTIKKAAPPSELKSVTVDFTKMKKTNNSSKPPPAPQTVKKSKSWNNKSNKSSNKPPTSVPKWKRNSNKNTKQNGSMSSKLAMFEANDKNAYATKSKIKSPPKPKKSKSAKTWKDKQSQKSQERNLKPSFVRKNTDPKNRKKAPPKKPKVAPPKELKTVNVDWKEQRKKLGAVKEKTKGVKNMFGSLTKKAKASVTADPADASKPPPKKMNLSFSAIKKSVSAPDDNEKKPMLPPPPPPAALGASKSFEKNKKIKTINHSRSGSAGYSNTKKTNAFKAPEPVKVARPEDYNEIKFKAADPFALKRAQKKKGTGRYARRNLAANAGTNQPSTRASSGSVGSKVSKPLKEQTNNINKVSPWKKKQQTVKPPPVPSNVNKKAPPVPSSGPPLFKKQGIERKGVLEAMPTQNSDGWIFNEGGMYKVEYKKHFKSMQGMNIFEGMPVVFQSIDKNVSNIRLLKKLDENTVKMCLTKKGKTKYDAKYFIYESIFEFNGNLSTNAFEIPKDCTPKEIGKMSEKIINAFLNTDGGILYLGIDKTWNVKGINSKNVNMEQIKKEVLSIVNTFKPKLKDSDLKKLKFSTVAILTNDGTLKDDVIVIKVTVPGPLKDSNGDNIVHTTSKGDKFKKNLNYIMKCY